jgi:signal transduction histidine kinase
VEFSVADTGIGIAPEKLEEIFESYAQASADTTRKYGGTGLGLAICKRLIDLQGGTIGVSSEPDRGSDFTFSIE